MPDADTFHPFLKIREFKPRGILEPFTEIDMVLARRVIEKNASLDVSHVVMEGFI